MNEVPLNPAAFPKGGRMAGYRETHREREEMAASSNRGLMDWLMVAYPAVIPAGTRI